MSIQRDLGFLSPLRPQSLLGLTDARWRGRLAMAVPLYGTTASQAACLFDVLGPEKAKEYYRGR